MGYWNRRIFIPSKQRLFLLRVRVTVCVCRRLLSRGSSLLVLSLCFPVRHCSAPVHPGHLLCRATASPRHRRALPPPCAVPTLAMPPRCRSCASADLVLRAAVLVPSRRLMAVLPPLAAFTDTIPCRLCTLPLSRVRLAVRFLRTCSHPVCRMHYTTTISAASPARSRSPTALGVISSRTWLLSSFKCTVRTLAAVS